MNFSIDPISEELKQNMIAKSVWKESCPVGFEDLSLLKLKHYDFTGKITQGEMVVHRKVSENAIKIFQELFAMKFLINKIQTMDQYDGDDDKSMDDNNSSCFNHRNIADSDKLSMHSYGLAIDINPAQNPYLVIAGSKSEAKIYPSLGADFLNRSNLRIGMVEPVVEVFVKYGFTEWGGRWNSPIDYHHFQVSRNELDKYLS